MKTYSTNSNAKRAGLKLYGEGNFSIVRRGPKSFEVIQALPNFAGARTTKRALLVDALQASDGATVAEIASKFGWANHSVRGMISTETRRLGLEVTTRKVEGRGRVYKVDA